MEIVVLIIMLMVGFSFILKLTFHSWKGRIAIALVSALFIMLTYDSASSQSKTQIQEWLSQPELMLDTSVWLTIDVAFQICFCILAAKAMLESLSGTERILLNLTLWIPGLLIFPTLFALLTELTFTFTGVDFATTAWVTAIVLFISVPIFAAMMRYLIPEKDIRLEMIFMVNLIIAALGVVATVNGRTAAAGTSEIELGAMIGVTLILIAGLIAGLILNRYLTRKKFSKLQ